MLPPSLNHHAAAQPAALVPRQQSGISERKVCIRCGREGHRSHACPQPKSRGGR